MVPYFPKQISNRAIFVYVAALIVVSVVFLNYAMQFGYVALGFVWVFGFFLIVSRYRSPSLRMRTVVPFLARYPCSSSEWGY